MRYDGEVTITDDGRDRPAVLAGTQRCVHCGMHFVITPGSKRVRGFCLKCYGPVCGPACAECVPMERMLESLERPSIVTAFDGKTFDHRREGAR